MACNKSVIAQEIKEDKIESAFNKILLNPCEDKNCCNGLMINIDCPIVRELYKKGYKGDRGKLPTCIDFSTAVLLCKAEMKGNK